MLKKIPFLETVKMTTDGNILAGTPENCVAIEIMGVYETPLLATRLDTGCPAEIVKTDYIKVQLRDGVERMATPEEADSINEFLHDYGHVDSWYEKRMETIFATMP